MSTDQDRNETKTKNAVNVRDEDHDNRTTKIKEDKALITQPEMNVVGQIWNARQNISGGIATK